MSYHIAVLRLIEVQASFQAQSNQSSYEARLPSYREPKHTKSDLIGNGADR